MRVLKKTLLGLLMLGLASPAVAQTAPKPVLTGVSSDLRCLLTMYALGQDKQRQQAALLGIYFFAGRISARSPGINLPAAVKAEAAKMNGQSLSEEARRCGPMVENGMRALQASLSGLRPSGPAGAAPGPAPAPAAAPPPTASGLPPAIPPSAPK
ncbi:MAG: hypothetical protein ACXU8S_01745 [Phenylobacterium sp.]